MKDLFTPRQVARAIDVSESSVKRWCDKGMIKTRHTAGGHRRIPLRDIIAFLRNGQIELIHPEVLGLPAANGKTPRALNRAAEQLTDALIAGEEALSRRIALDLYVAEHSLSVICDEVLAVALRSVGDCWEDGKIEVYQERRSVGIAMRVIHDLGALIPSVSKDAPLAIGGAVAGDYYALGTSMAELVLRDAKWNAVSIGNNLPLETIAAAIREQRPQLCWLSCTHIKDKMEFLSGYNELYEEFGIDIAFVVGGQALDEDFRQQMKFSAHCDNMQHLEAFAQTHATAIQKKTP